jgi:hypothetical protein
MFSSLTRKIICNSSSSSSSSSSTNKIKFSLVSNVFYQMIFLFWKILSLIEMRFLQSSNQTTFFAFCCSWSCNDSSIEFFQDQLVSITVQLFHSTKIIIITVVIRVLRDVRFKIGMINLKSRLVDF